LKTTQSQKNVVFNFSKIRVLFNFTRIIGG